MPAVSFKKEFREEIVPEYRTLLKENTVSLTIVDYQMQIIAFSLKKFMELLPEAQGNEEALRKQVFKDVSSIVSDFFPMVGGNVGRYGSVLEDAETWFKQLAVEPYLTARRFVREYYSQLESGNPIDCLGLERRFNLH